MPALMDRLAKVLTQALRSDYAHFVSGEELHERVAALMALAGGGTLAADYAVELARRALALPTEALAQAASAVAALPNKDARLLAGTMDALWGRVQVVARDGRPVYGGLAGIGGSTRILPSEARALSEVIRAVAVVTPEELGEARAQLAALVPLPRPRRRRCASWHRLPTRESGATRRRRRRRTGWR